MFDQVGGTKSHANWLCLDGILPLLFSVEKKWVLCFEDTPFWSGIKHTRKPLTFGGLLIGLRHTRMWP